MEREPGRVSTTVQPSIELRIEELILHGFSPGDHHRIGAAVERELGHLLSERGLPAALGRGGRTAEPGRRVVQGAAECQAGSGRHPCG